MVELGQPEQLPLSSTVTIPLLKDLNFISPPSLATAGLIFESKTSLILLITSFECSGLDKVSFFIIFFFITTSLPFE